MLIFDIFEPNDFWKVVDWIVTNVHEKGKIRLFHENARIWIWI